MAADLTLRELWALSAAAWGLEVCIDPDATADPLGLAATLQRLHRDHPELVTFGKPIHKTSIREDRLPGHRVLRIFTLPSPRPSRFFTLTTLVQVSATGAGRDELIRARLFLGVGFLNEASLVTARRVWALARLGEALDGADRAWTLAAEREPELSEQDWQIYAAAIYLCEIERAIKSPGAVELARWHKRDWQHRDPWSLLRCDTNEVCPLGLMLARQGAAGIRVLALVRWAQQLGLVSWTELLNAPEPKLRETEALVAQWRIECGP